MRWVKAKGSSIKRPLLSLFLYSYGESLGENIPRDTSFPSSSNPYNYSFCVNQAFIPFRITENNGLSYYAKMLRKYLRNAVSESPIDSPLLHLRNFPSLALREPWITFYSSLDDRKNVKNDNP